MQIPNRMRNANGVRHRSSDPPRLGRLRGFFDRRAEPAVAVGVRRRGSMPSAAQGAEIVELDDPVDFEQVLDGSPHGDGRRGGGGPFRLARRVSRRLSASHPRPDPGRAIACRRIGISCEPKDRMGRTHERCDLGCRSSSDEKLDASSGSRRRRSARRPIHRRPAIRHSTHPGATPGCPRSRFRSAWRPTACRSPSSSSVWHLRDVELLRVAQWCEQAIRTWRQ